MGRQVGTGFSDADRQKLRAALKDVMLPAKDVKRPEDLPSYLQITGSAKERPHVWITDPERSVVLEVTTFLVLCLFKWSLELLRNCTTHVCLFSKLLPMTLKNNKSTENNLPETRVFRGQSAVFWTSYCPHVCFFSGLVSDRCKRTSESSRQRCLRAATVCASHG
jgi:hypothetical protein